MTVPRITAGVVLGLAALFAGGCSLVWTGLFVVDSSFLVVWPITLLGYAFAAGTGLAAWRMLRPMLAAEATTPPREEGG